MLSYRKDGSTFWDALTLAPVEGPDGRVSHFVGVVTDITERNTPRCAYLLTQRVAGAQRQPEADQGLGRSAEAGCAGDHAQPKNLRRRALEFSRGPRLGETSARRHPRDRGNLHPCPVSPGPRPGHRCPGRHRQLRPTWSGRRVDRLGERSVPGAQGVRRDRLHHRPPERFHPRGTSRGGGRQRGRQARHARGGRGLPAFPLDAGSAGDRGAELLSPARSRGGGASRGGFPTISMATIQDFGGWDKAQSAYFGDGGMFDRIYAPGK